MILTERHNINKNEISFSFCSAAEFGTKCVFEIRAVWRKKDKHNCGISKVCFYA